MIIIIMYTDVCSIGSDMESKVLTVIKERIPLVEQQPATPDE